MWRHSLALLCCLEISKTRCFCHEFQDERGLRTKLPTSPNDIIFKKVEGATHESELIICYDHFRRNPSWVYERHFPVCNTNNADGSTQHNKKRQMHFYSEKAHKHDNIRVYPQDYLNNDYYDRGHMAAAANFKDTQDGLQATFSMANVCPQQKDLNKGFWKSLEHWIRESIINSYNKKHGRYTYDEVVVITGPAYLPVQRDGEFMYANKAIGIYPKLIHVPTHFFKIIVCKKCFKGKNDNYTSSDSNGDTLHICVGAFLVPNMNIPMNTVIQDKSMFEPYAIQISELETLVGCNMLSNIITHTLKNENYPNSSRYDIVNNAQQDNRISSVINDLDGVVASIRYIPSFDFIQMISTVSNTIPMGYKHEKKSVHIRGVDVNSDYGHIIFQHLCSNVPCGVHKSKKS